MVDRLLALLAADPEFRHFMMDGQTIVLDDYLAIRPDRLADLQGHVASGRLLVGPWYILPDEFLVSPEALVRNLLAGRRIARRFGEAMPVGYIPDTFGHISQLPQVFRGFGLDSAVVWRGLPDVAAIFTWRSSSGDSVTGLNLREGYGDLAWAPADDKGFAEVVRQAVDKSLPHAVGSCVLLMDGTDHLEARPDRPRLLAAANELLADEGMRLVHSTLPDYLAEVRSGNPSLEEVRGEFRSPRRNNVLPGVLSARMWIKQRNRVVETLLTSWSEPFLALASAVGAASEIGLEPASVDGLLGEAWRLLLQNQPHDSVCGCSVDQVHEEMRTRYDQAEQIGAELVRRALSAVAMQVTTTAAAAAEAIPIVVFNPTGHEASDAVTVSVQAPPWWSGLEIVDEAGAPVTWAVTGHEEVPFSALGIDEMDVVTRLPVENAERIAGQSVLRLSFERQGDALLIRALLGGHDLGDRAGVAATAATVRASLSTEPRLRPRLEIRVVPRSHITLAAKAVPAVGHATYFVRPRGAGMPRGASGEGAPHGAPAEIENEYLHVAADPQDGTLTLFDKRTGNVMPGLNRFVDEGDRGDEYNFCPVETDVVVDRPAVPPVIEVLKRGPVEHVLEVSMTYALPAALAPERRGRAGDTVPVAIVTRARLATGVPRLDLETTVDNRAADHRLRVAFPLPWAPATWRTETPWDVVERPVAPPGFERDPAYDGWQERPVAQQPQYRFCDVSGLGAGMTMVNRGLPEVEARATLGETGARTMLYLTLLRCVGWLSRDDLPVRKGHAGPGLATPGAQCIGRHRFEYALIPHSGDWLSTLPMVESFAAPMRAVTTTVHNGALSPRLSLVTVDDPAVSVSALKRTADGQALALRLWNASARPVRTTVRLGLPLKAARLSRLDETEGDDLPLAQDRSLPVSLAPFQAVTMLLYSG